MASTQLTNVMSQDEIDGKTISNARNVDTPDADHTIVFQVTNWTQYNLIANSNSYFFEGGFGSAPVTISPFTMSEFSTESEGWGDEGGVEFLFQGIMNDITGSDQLRVDIGFENPVDRSNQGSIFFNQYPEYAEEQTNDNYNHTDNSGTFSGTGDDGSTKVDVVFSAALTVGGGDNATYTVEITQKVTPTS